MSKKAKTKNQKNVPHSKEFEESLRKQVGEYKKARRNWWLYTAVMFIAAIVFVILGVWKLSLLLLGMWVFFMLGFIFR